MQYQDALIVATVLTLLMTATVFLPAHPYETLEADAGRYCYDLAAFVLQSWITSFAALTGLTVYAKSKQANKG